jgi:hypothetical protein
MEDRLADVEKILIDELKGKGIELRVIPRFIKDIANSLLADPYVNLSDVNERLHFLGWEDIELDYHTLQLAIATFEREEAELAA